MTSAATSQEYPELNGFAPSWADISTVINVAGGATLKDIDYRSINWTSTVERADQRGASGGRVIKRTAGQLTHEGSCEYYKSGLRKLLAVLLQVAPTRGNQRLVSLVSFDIVILHSVPGDPEIYHEEMRGCRLSSFESAMTEGPDAEVVAMDLAPMETAWIVNGAEVVLL